MLSMVIHVSLAHVDPTASVEYLTTKQFVLVWVDIWVRPPPVDQSVSLAPTVRQIKHVAIRNVSTPV